MNYSVEILLEQKNLLEEEMRFAEGKELEETKQRYADVCTALNKLNLPDVSQQRELLLAYEKYQNEKILGKHKPRISKQMVDDFLANNCG